jgi:hypothetical protein
MINPMLPREIVEMPSLAGDDESYWHDEHTTAPSPLTSTWCAPAICHAFFVGPVFRTIEHVTLWALQPARKAHCRQSTPSLRITVVDNRRQPESVHLEQLLKPRVVYGFGPVCVAPDPLVETGHDD